MIDTKSVPEKSELAWLQQEEGSNPVGGCLRAAHELAAETDVTGFFPRKSRNPNQLALIGVSV